MKTPATGGPERAGHFVDIRPIPGLVDITETPEEFRPFDAAREDAYIQCYQDLQERLATNPTPTAMELGLGTLVEGLEPQVRDAVVGMWLKGYRPASSGFAGQHHELQSIEGYFKIDAPTRARLGELGASVSSGDDGWTSLSFRSQTANMDMVKQRWLQLVEALPVTQQPPNTANLPVANEFEQMYLEGRLANEYSDSWLHRTGNYAIHPGLRNYVASQVQG